MATKAEVLTDNRSGLSTAPRVAQSAHPRQVRVLIADDHPVVRKGVINCLARHERLAVVGEAEDGHEAIAKAKELSADIVLMDIDMPKLNGLCAAEVLHRERPRMKIVIFSVHSPAHDALRILKTGAWGFLSKGMAPSELIEAIEGVSAGRDFFSLEVAQAAVKQMSRVNEPHKELSAREREVLLAIADGLSNKEIAARLGIEVSTVETHRERIMRKLNIRSVAGLTRFALSEGLISLPTLADISCHTKSS
jgi:RNA polymerase sigma factor (sigma-70 family)